MTTELSPHLTPIVRTTVTDEIVRQLTSFIVDQGLKPGDKLPPEREIMRRLCVGRSSLREAVKVLSGIGVIDVVTREGMYVGGAESSILSKPITWAILRNGRSAREAIEARRAIEIELAGLAALRASDDAVAEIREWLARLGEGVEDSEAYGRADLEFHLAVAHAADSRVLSQILETLRSLMRAWIDRSIASQQGHPQSYVEHIPICEAIARHDVNGARAAMEAHLDAAGRRLIEEM